MTIDLNTLISNKFNTVYVGVHIIRPMGPQNANRDEDGRPKSAYFGGHDRLRQSSQSNKHALRSGTAFAGLGLATRTRQAGIHIFLELEKAEKTGVPFTLAEKLYYSKCANAALGGGETLKFDDKTRKDLEKTFTDEENKFYNDKGLSKSHARDRAVQNTLQSKQAIFITQKEVASLEDFASDLVTLHKDKRQAQAVELADKTAREGLLGHTVAEVDIALFGRMVAEAPEFNSEAAASFSHAITTHAAVFETDYLTGVEEWNHYNGQGAATIADNHFAAGIFYSFACVNFSLLVENLGGDQHLACQTVGRLVRGLAETTPGGKRTSFAQYERAAFIEVEVGSDLPNKMDVAFLSPVNDKSDLLRASIQRFRDTDKALRTAYGITNEVCEFCCYAPAKGNEQKPHEVDTINELSEWTSNLVASSAPIGA